MQSVKNQTYVPLGSGHIFLGSYDDVLNYNTAYYTIHASTNCEVIVYQSNDKTNYTESTYNYTTSGTSVTQNVLLNQRYIYITVRNSSVNDQTYLQFTMIYK